jgi:hypothetical protein
LDEEWDDSADFLAGEGINLRDEISRADVWAFSKEMLDQRIEELSMCTGLQAIKAVLSE